MRKRDIRAARREAEDLKRTGWPPGMLQDDSSGFSKWLASKPDARLHAREAAEAIGLERDAAEGSAP